MDLKEIRSSDFIINLDTLHFFWPIFIFRTENALGRRGPSPTTREFQVKAGICYIHATFQEREKTVLGLFLAI